MFLCTLTSQIFTILSVPTDIAKDPSNENLTEKMLPWCPYKLATFFPVSVSQTFTSLSISPPDKSTVGSIGLKQTVLTMALWPTNSIYFKSSCQQSSPFSISSNNGVTRILIILSLDPVATSLEVRLQSTQ